MKIVLSRKGFDSDSGGAASPILPDGRLLSVPIPDSDGTATYSELWLEPGVSYHNLMSGLYPRIHSGGMWQPLHSGAACHLDPDIRTEARARPVDWRGSLGQIGAAQRHLEGQGVGPGDLFLFFGWFRHTRYERGNIRFDGKDRQGRHIIFGYLQVGESLALSGAMEAPQWLRNHPHTSPGRRKKPTNTIYAAREKLTWDESLPGFSVFDHHDALVLTKKGAPRSRWALPEEFEGVIPTYHSALSWKEGYFQSSGRGQEFVFEATPALREWACRLIGRFLSVGRQQAGAVLDKAPHHLIGGI